MQTSRCGMRNAECGMGTARDCMRPAPFRIPNSAPPKLGQGRIRRIRRSFTLVELMVVITIIAILATIALQVVGGLIGQARDAATKATISKIQGLLNTRAQAFDRMTVMRPDGKGTVRRYLENSTEYQWVQQYYGKYATQKSTQVMLARKL